MGIPVLRDLELGESLGSIVVGPPAPGVFGKGVILQELRCGGLLRM